MNDAIRCPGCDVQLLLPALPAGQTAACPRCQCVFEPARLRSSPVPTPIARTKTPAVMDNLGDDEPIIPQQRRPEAPRGAWRGRLAVSLLFLSCLAFALQAYGKMELISLIRAEEEMGAQPFGPRARIGRLRAIPDLQRVRLDVRVRLALLEDRWEWWEDFTRAANIILHVTFWPAALLVLIWLHRAHRNLPGLNAMWLSYTPAWAVLCFIIPIFNFIMPFAFIQEIWRACHPHALETTDAWRKTPFARSVRLWWVLYAAAIVLWLGAYFTRPSFLDTYDQLWTSAWCGVAASLCSGGACALLIYIIVKITQRQQQRYNNL